MPNRQTASARKPEASYWPRFCEAMNIIGPGNLSSPLDVAVFPAQQVVVQPAQKPKGGLDEDMRLFISNFTGQIYPIHEGYSQKAKDEQMKRRQKMSAELTRVFNGKVPWDVWFHKTKTALSLHPVNFYKLIVDSLEGCTGPDALEMRRAYEAQMAAVRGTY